MVSCLDAVCVSCGLLALAPPQKMKVTPQPKHDCVGIGKMMRTFQLFCKLGPSGRARPDLKTETKLTDQSVQPTAAAWLSVEPCNRVEMSLREACCVRPVVVVVKHQEQPD